MKKLQNKWVVLWMIVSINSCNAITYDIELPDVEKKLVVNGTFEEGKPFDLIISQNITRATSQKMKPVTNATILLYEEGTFIDTLKVFENSSYGDSVVRWHYTSNIRAISNHEYNIEVIAEGFSSVKAKSTVPEKAEIQFVNWEKVERTEQHSSEYLRINLKVDKIQPDGYYSLAVSNRRSIYDTYKSYTLFDMNDPVLGRYKNFWGTDYMLFSGAIIPSETYAFSLDLSENFYRNLFNDNVVLFELISLSEEEFRYRETLTAQKNVDIRISEPIKVFSNIEGGLGIFAGISVARDSLVWQN